jgi:hypothetical protein
MHLGIMQPYFLPYLGYFQLMKMVDEFVIYDNIEFSKGGWIHRNRILCHGGEVMITLPLKKDSDFRDIRDRQLADNWPHDKMKIYNRIKEQYRKAPYFSEVMHVVEDCLNCTDTNLFEFLRNSLIATRAYIGINTPFIISSDIHMDHSLHSAERVKATCKARGASVYTNPSGGMALYDKEDFKQCGIDLQFTRVQPTVSYKQFAHPFVPSLSILDVMMFNSREEIDTLLDSYELIDRGIPHGQN